MTNENSAHKLYVEEKEQRPEEGDFLHEALGISDERREQLNEIVNERMHVDGNINESIQFLNNRRGWTPDETAYALFILGYTVHGIDIIEDALQTMEVLCK